MVNNITPSPISAGPSAFIAPETKDVADNTIWALAFAATDANFNEEPSQKARKISQDAPSPAQRVANVGRYISKYTYEGEMLYNLADGKGKMAFANGSVYEGDLQDGKLHGKGKMTFASENVYEGDWQNGKEHGKGKMTFANGCVYEGDFKDGMLHGKGKMAFPNGKVYEGDFQNGKPHTRVREN